MEKYFIDFELMKRKIGEILTKNTKRRCDQLKAAVDFGVYLTTGLGKPHPLTGNLKGFYGIKISANISLIVKPDVKCLDLTSIKKGDLLIIKGMVDYHGQKHEWLIP